MDIDELSALRIVVLEWQTRSKTRLLVGLSEDEVVSLQDAAQANAFGASALGFRSSILPEAIAKDDDFLTATKRQSRLVEIYLAERRYILKVCEWLLYRGLCDEIPEAAPSGIYDVREAEQAARSHWIFQLGRDMVKESGIAGDASAGNRRYALDCIEALEDRMARITSGQGSGYVKAEGGRDEAQEAYIKNAVLEATHILQILFVVLDTTSEITASDVVLAWFRLNEQYDFFDNFDMVRIPFSCCHYRSLIPTSPTTVADHLCFLSSL